MLTSLNLFTHTQCSVETSTSLPTGNLEEETQLLADQSIQMIFNEFMNLKEEFFTYFFSGKEFTLKNSIYDKKVIKIFDQIHKLCLSSKNNPIVKMVESYLESIEEEKLKLAFLETAPDNKTVSLSIKELDRIFRKNFGLYLLAVNSLVKELYKKEVFAEEYKNKICTDFCIPEDTKIALEGSDINVIITKIYEYRLDNLKDIFILLHLKKRLFFDGVYTDFRKANTILNLIIQELIFLEHKFSKLDKPNLKKLGFSKMPPMREIFHSHEFTNYSLLCASYFRYLSSKIRLQKESTIESLKFLFEEIKIPEYFSLLDNSQIKFYVQILAIDIINNTKIYEFLYKQKPEQNTTDQESEQPEIVQGPENIEMAQELEQITINPGPEQSEMDQENQKFEKLRNDILNYFCYFRFINLEPSEKKEKSIENVFFGFDDAISGIIDVLELPVTKNDFQISLSKKIQHVSELSEDQSKNLAVELLKTLPDVLEKYLVFDLQSLFQDECFMLDTEKAKSIIGQISSSISQAKNKIKQAESYIKRAETEKTRANRVINQTRRKTRQSEREEAKAIHNKKQAENTIKQAESVIKRNKHIITKAENILGQVNIVTEQTTSGVDKAESEIEKAIKITLNPKIAKLREAQYLSYQQLKEKMDQLTKDDDVNKTKSPTIQELRNLKKQVKKVVKYEEKFKKDLLTASNSLFDILLFLFPETNKISLDIAYPEDDEIINYYKESLAYLEKRVRTVYIDLDDEDNALDSNAMDIG